MANLALCRMVRSASALARLVPRNNVLVSTKAHGFFRQIESASPFSTCFKQPLRVSSGTLSQCSSRKALFELPASPLLQYRASSSHGDHVRLWQVERLVSVAFIVLLPACIVLENAVVDALFATLVVMHAHWGLEAVVVDYARPSVVGNILPKIAFGALYLVSAMTFVGLLALVYNGPGIGKTVKNFWSIGSEAPTKKA